MKKYFFTFLLFIFVSAKALSKDICIDVSSLTPYFRQDEGSEYSSEYDIIKKRQETSVYFFSILLRYLHEKNPSSKIEDLYEWFQKELKKESDFRELAKVLYFSFSDINSDSNKADRFYQNFINSLSDERLLFEYTHHQYGCYGLFINGIEKMDNLFKICSSKKNNLSFSSLYPIHFLLVVLFGSTPVSSAPIISSSLNITTAAATTGCSLTSMAVTPLLTLVGGGGITAAVLLALYKKRKSILRCCGCSETETETNSEDGVTITVSNKVNLGFNCCNSNSNSEQSVNDDVLVTVRKLDKKGGNNLVKSTRERKVSFRMTEKDFAVFQGGKVSPGICSETTVGNPINRSISAGTITTNLSMSSMSSMSSMAILAKASSMLLVEDENSEKQRPPLLRGVSIQSDNSSPSRKVSRTKPVKFTVGSRIEETNEDTEKFPLTSSP